MANENKFQIIIPEEEVRKVQEALKNIENILKPYLAVLTPEERSAIPKMGNKTSPFVEKIVEYTESSPEFTPMYMNVGNLKNSFETVNKLTLLLRPIEQLEKAITDTIMLSGSEAYKNALIYYNSVKEANKNSIANAEIIFEDLKVRFEKTKVKKGNNTE